MIVNDVPKTEFWTKTCQAPVKLITATAAIAVASTAVPIPNLLFKSSKKHLVTVKFSVLKIPWKMPFTFHNSMINTIMRSTIWSSKKLLLWIQKTISGDWIQSVHWLQFQAAIGCIYSICFVLVQWKRNSKKCSVPIHRVKLFIGQLNSVIIWYTLKNVHSTMFSIRWYVQMLASIQISFHTWSQTFCIHSRVHCFFCRWFILHWSKHGNASVYWIVSRFTSICPKSRSILLKKM